MRAPFVSASGALSDRSLVLLPARGLGRGTSGFGEAAPLPDYDGVGVEDVLEALEQCRATLRAPTARCPAEAAGAVRRACVLPPALAAIDLALWDLEGTARRRAGVAAARRRRPASPSRSTPRSRRADRAGAAAQAAAARAAGFRCVKVKVGHRRRRRAAARPCGRCSGREVAIRLDANGAWSVEEAVAALRALTPVGIELCEEPVHGLAEIARSPRASRTSRSRSTRPRRRPGRSSERVCRGGVPEDRGLRRDHRRAATRPGGPARLATRCTSPRRSTGRSGSRRRCTRRAVVRPERPCGLATLALFADREDPLPAARRADRAPGRARASATGCSPGTARRDASARSCDSRSRLARIRRGYNW